MIFQISKSKKICGFTKSIVQRFNVVATARSAREWRRLGNITRRRVE